MVTRTEETAQFVAYEQDGTQHTICILTDFHDTSSQWGQSEAASGLQTLMTTDGRHVNYKGKGRYEIVGHPMIPLTSDDPAAP